MDNKYKVMLNDATSISICHLPSNQFDPNKKGMKTGGGGGGGDGKVVTISM